ncbi:MAG: response regulator [Gammaproteobacteria bacterium]
MRALVIEGEAKTAAYLRQGLSENGFNVEVCANGDDRLHQVLTVENGLIILDVMLPERDRYSVLAALRRAGIQMPVLFLTARDTVYDNVKGLELCADDYLAKPFDFAELLARVRTILRRGPTRQAEILRVANLQLDLPRRKVHSGGARFAGGGDHVDACALLYPVGAGRDH